MRTLSYFLSAVRGNFATIPDKNVHSVFSRADSGFADCSGGGGHFFAALSPHCFSLPCTNFAADGPCSAAKKWCRKDAVCGQW